MKSFLKKIWISVALILVLPILLFEVPFREIRRSWRNSAIYATYCDYFKQWINYWKTTWRKDDD